MIEGECWDNDKMELMKGDYLRFLKVVFIDFYLHKYSHVCTYIFFIINVPLWAPQFYFYAKTMNAKLFIQYAPSSILFLVGFISMIVHIVQRKNIEHCLDQMKKYFWSLRTGSKELQESILKKAAYMTYIVKVNIFLSCMTYLFVLLRMRARPNWEILYQVTFLKENFPEYAPVLIIIFLVSLTYMIIPLISMIYVFTYFVLHAYFQSLILNERIMKVPEGFPDTVETAYDDAVQAQIAQRLRFCAIRGFFLKRYCEENSRKISLLVVLYVILAFLLIVCYIATWYFDPDIYYPLLSVIVLDSGYSGLVIAEVGQLVEDESLRTYGLLTALPWYNFNIRNQKFLMFGSMHASIPMTVSPFETFPINRRIILQFYKIISSLSAVVAKSSEKWERDRFY